MLTLTHNYYDRHATINCNFKSLKILQKIQNEQHKMLYNKTKQTMKKKGRTKNRNDCILCMNENKMYFI